MKTVSVMYPNHQGSTFDMTYYCQSQIPMVRQKMGAALKGVVVEQGIGGEGPGSPAPYLALAHLFFDSLQAFHYSFGPHVQEFEADIPNYTNTQPTIQISEVKQTAGGAVMPVG